MSKVNNPMQAYHQLDARCIIETVDALYRRVSERFPDSGLSKLVNELCGVANRTTERIEWIRRPNYWLRIAAGILIAAVLAILELMLLNLNQFWVKDFLSFIQMLDSSLSSLVFIGATILFFITWEKRIKRTRALEAIHELRAMAHIVDMHQLTKDPDRYLLRGPDTASSPKRSMTPFELNRYLDYCSEALALISKIAALHVQGFQDEVVLEAVDDVEDLTASLSRKIWQKLMILQHLRDDLEV